jgi:hypothetical protein
MLGRGWVALYPHSLARQDPGYETTGALTFDLRALVLVFISLAMLYMATRSYIPCLRIESDQCEGRWMRCFVGDLVDRCCWWWWWLLPSWGRVSRLYE